MPDFSPEVQRLSENLAEDLVDDLLRIIPRRGKRSISVEKSVVM